MPKAITVFTSKPRDFKTLEEQAKFLTGTLVRIKRRPMGFRKWSMAWNAAETNAFIKRTPVGLKPR